MGTKRDERHDERERGERYRLRPNADALAIAELVAMHIRREREKRTDGGQ
ncbi:MAG: hypothetical protein J0L92_03460 [Deltaproteobacteria bacterium]|nr:hypothetical protein [Deltaproteobacteria bacterium]